eukprot:scaffold48713_cov28-Tisochrysis_lutea.AAC.5
MARPNRRISGATDDRASRGLVRSAPTHPSAARYEGRAMRMATFLVLSAVSAAGMMLRSRVPRRLVTPVALANARPLSLADDGAVTKVVTEEAPPNASGPPPYGAVVQICYTCSFENGTLFDKRYWERPFEFQLNTGRAVDGLELGVGSMVIGERATLTCAPEWAFGSAGAGDTVPGDAVVVYDVKLLSWSDGPPIESDDLDLRAYRADMEGRPVSKGTTDVFSWIESGTEVAISFSLADGKRARDIECDFRPRRLRVRIGEGDAVEGELRGKVCPEDCYWIIDDESGERVLKVILAKSILYDRWEGVFRSASSGDHQTHASTSATLKPRGSEISIGRKCVSVGPGFVPAPGPATQWARPAMPWLWSGRSGCPGPTVGRPAPWAAWVPSNGHEGH